MTTYESMSDAKLLTILCGSAGAALANKPLAQLFGFEAVHYQPDLLSVQEERLPYLALPQLGAAKELVKRAMASAMRTTTSLAVPDKVKDYLKLHIGHLEHEVFCCVWLDGKNRVIAMEELFRGTLSQTSVFPREVVKSALAHNASSVIFSHNHPSGCVEPSSADERLTQVLRTALKVVDVQVLDHVIIGGTNSMSFAQRGLL